MAEHGLSAPLLGVAWDGTGLGLDDTVWGGEFLRVAPSGFERIAHLRTFRLPGGERAVREPRRVALGLLYELLGEELFTREDLAPLRGFSSVERGVLRGLLARRFQRAVDLQRRPSLRCGGVPSRHPADGGFRGTGGDGAGIRRGRVRNGGSLSF